MADNIPLPNSVLVAASDEIAGVQYQRVKLTLGADGINEGDVGSTNALPVALDAASLAALENISVTVTNTSTEITNDIGNPIPISGTVTISNPTAGGLTDTQLRATPVPVSGSFYQATQPVSGTVSVSNMVGLTDTELRAAAVPVSGTVTVSNPTATGLTDTQLRASAVPVSLTSVPSHPVTGTFWQATQPVSGTVTVSNPTAQGLTDTQLRATAVPMSAAALPLPTGASTEVTLAALKSALDALSAKITAANTGAIAGTVALDAPTLAALESITAAVTGSVSVTNFTDNGLTDTQLRATPVSVTVSNPVGLTDTQLRAAAVPISIAAMPSTPVTGTFWQGTQPVSMAALPVDAATETTNVALKAVQDSIQAQTEVIEYALMALLNKITMPDKYARTRVVIADTNGNEINSAYYSINTALVGDASNGRSYSRMSEPWNFHDIASTRIYNNILVT